MQTLHAYQQLLDIMEEMEIVDTHEHLPAEAERVAKNPDFSLMFNHYCYADLLSAGMAHKDVEAFYNEKTPVEEKWRLFEPYYRMIEDGSYCRAAHLAMERFYGFPRLETLADAEAVTAAIRRASAPGLYRKVLKDACRIRVSMNFGTIGDDPEFFHPVIFSGHYLEALPATIRGLEEKLGVCCSSLDRYVEAVREDLTRMMAQGGKGIKIHIAYMRDLYFAPRTHAEAETVFNRINEEGYGWRPVSLGYEEARPLQDYMMHRVAEMAGELNVPMVIHSAMQAHDRHNPDDARPLRLWNLPNRYRNVDFIILHGGFPWMDDAGMLAKHYSNVYLDMAWAHLMSPAISSRALQDWIDLVPMNKILGFGGDYSVVEKVYGHLTLARQAIARALAAKMEEGMSLARAQAWIQAMMVDNPARVYRLDSAK